MECSEGLEPVKGFSRLLGHWPKAAYVIYQESPSGVSGSCEQSAILPLAPVRSSQFSQFLYVGTYLTVVLDSA